MVDVRRDSGSATSPVTKNGASSDGGLGTTHDRLLRVSADMFAEEGFEKVTVRDIASRLGMTTGALYMHFRNKAELLAAAVDLRVSEMLERATPGTDLHQYVVDSVAALDERIQMRALFVEAGVAARTDPELRQLLARTHGERLTQWIGYYATWENQDSDDVDLEKASMLVLLWAIELGIGVLESYQAVEVSSAELAEQIDLLLRSAAHERARPQHGRDSSGSSGSATGGWIEMPQGELPSPDLEPTGRAEQTRDLLLTIATDLFCTRGYRVTTVRDLARAANLTTGSIYGNFPNKQAVLAAVVEVRISEDLEQIPPDIVASSTPGQLVGLHFRDYGRRTALRGLILEGASASRWDSAARQRIREVQQKHMGFWSTAFEAWAAEHQVDVPFPMLAMVTVFWGAELGLGLLEAMGLDTPPAEDLADLFERMLFDSGL